MTTAIRGSKGFFTHMVDRMFGSEPLPQQPDKRMQNLAQKRMNIRAVGVREGFQAMRARSEEMAQRLEAFKKQRRNETASAQDAGEAGEPVETIVLASRT